MLFLNPWLLLALAGVSIPVILHLIRRQAAKPIDWGAMRFLYDTLSERRRRIEWEDILLMASRCLLLALAALAVARPFVPPGSKVAWSFVLPAVLLAVVLFGASFVPSSRKVRGGLRGISVVLLLVLAGMIAFEQFLHLRRFETSGSRDVALVIDASSSMGRETAEGTLFGQAIEEARRIVGEAPRGTSFVVVVGGPAPQALTQTPLAHRADVLEQLDGLKLIGGGFRAHETLGVATLALAEGVHSAKQIIVLTDGQRHGWRFGDAGAWSGLEEAWESLPEKPKLMLRRLPAPDSLRNAGIAGISTSRALVGTDRPTLLRVAVENTGDAALAPGAVVLEVDGSQVGREALGVLVPGQQETVEFRHRFKTAGPRVVTARIEGVDELAEDNRADHVVTVRERLPVLLVDGNPAGSFFDRAAGHAALALAPTGALLKGQEVGDKFLMDPRVVAAPDFVEKDLAGAEVIVLADVPRLSGTLAGKVASRVAQGAGLLVIAGPRSDAGFYNAWTGPDGSVMPLELGDEAVSDDGVLLAAATFQHESLAVFRDEGASDLGRAVLQRWRRSAERDQNGVVGAAFSNGDPFLAGRYYGGGRSLLVTCALDRRAGSLPARTSFVPLVHELVSWAAGGGLDLNVEASWSPAVPLGHGSGGLLGRFRRISDKQGRVLLERVDPTIAFDWRDGSPSKKVPKDRFSAEWSGRLMPPVDGEYLLEAEVDDRVTVRINSRMVLSSSNQDPRDGRVTLEAGRPVAVELRYEEDHGEAKLKLFWTPPGGARSIIPASAWLPADGAETESFMAIDPLGLSRKARVMTGRMGRELRIDGPAVPGLYKVELPEAVRDGVAAFAGIEKLPVVVRQDIRESRQEPMQADDLAQMRAKVDTLEPGSIDDVLAVLSGRGFGREITRIVAVSALLLLLIETALARWVSKSRRAGEAESIEFGEVMPVKFGEGGRR